MTAAPGAATYPGDHREAVGRIVGPTTYGAQLVAVSADYDAAVDRTRLTFRPLAEGERVGRDAFGQFRLAAAS